MKIIILSLLISLSISSMAIPSRYNAYKHKKNDKRKITRIDHVVYSLNYEILKKKIIDYLNKEHINLDYQQESGDELYLDFIVNANQKKSYDSLIHLYGYSTDKEVVSSNSEEEIEKINTELKFLEEKRASYLKIMEKLDEKSDSYLTLWNENKAIEDKIFEIKASLKELTLYKGKLLIQLHLLDESNSPQYTEVSFVNMPGFEYSMLMVESPLQGVSSEYYQGYFLKYLFTRGKSFFSLGAYKSTETNSDSLKFAEMFLIGFGQDFYSRHLGRGSRKFFNLYSGYALGGVLSTGVGSNYYDIYIAPSIGLEIFKNKYILFDTKLSYFVPIANNKNQRGFTLSASFNFMF